MSDDSELILISGLQHIVFCQRRWVLIYIDQEWQENVLTVEGKQLHERADSGEYEARPELRIARSLRLRSTALGITGIADVVEFYRESSMGVAVWRPFPVEYKRGSQRPDTGDTVQLCAQALCLEEMLGVDVPRGAIFYGKPRRRTQVEFDTALRNKVKELVEKAKYLTEKGTMPPPRVGKHCKNCSMEDICMPNLPQKSAQGYIKKLLKEASNETTA